MDGPVIMAVIQTIKIISDAAATWLRRRRYTDQAFVINLERSKERLERVNTEYQQHGLRRLFGKLVRYEAVDGRSVRVPEYWYQFDTYTAVYTGVDADAAYGCYASHCALLQQFLHSGAAAMLVLEDDAQFEEGFAARFRKFYRHVPRDWEVLLLGYSENGAPRVIDAWCKRAGDGGCNLTHAYIINPQAAAAYLEQLEANKLIPDFTANEPIDCQLSRIHGRMKVYMPTTPLVTQHPTESTIYKA
jgi:GR25 family glycosyltransferase involved in LPS biosynthesis